MPTKKLKPAKSFYSVHPSIAYIQAVIDNLAKNTGKPIDEWVRVVKKSAPHDERGCKDWLKKEHKLGGTSASIIAHRAFGPNQDETDPTVYLRNAPEWVESMYAGAKSALRPIHDALIELGLSMGSDVKICPCQTIVPLYRNHVIAQTKPATRTRVDFGLALKGAKKKLSKRLIDTGGLQKNDRITHRFPIESLADIDAEVKEWLKIAYDLDA